MDSMWELRQEIQRAIKYNSMIMDKQNGATDIYLICKTKNETLHGVLNYIDSRRIGDDKR